MKKWMLAPIAGVLLLVLLLTVGMNLRPSFPFSASSFQWHLADMCEEYIQWETQRSEDGYLYMRGISNSYPAFVLKTDAKDRIYEIGVTEYLDWVWPSAGAIEELIDETSIACQTADLLARGKDNSYERTRELNRSVMSPVLREVRNEGSLSSYVDKPFHKSSQIAQGVYCTHDLRFDNWSGTVKYEIIISPKRK